tara:strand:+ start:138 stop:929 length:792 start_codon:yes stop_codon:yes gene_type:complete
MLPSWKTKNDNNQQAWKVNVMTNAYEVGQEIESLRDRSDKILEGSGLPLRPDEFMEAMAKSAEIDQEMFDLIPVLAEADADTLAGVAAKLEAIETLLSLLRVSNDSEAIDSTCDLISKLVSSAIVGVRNTTSQTKSTRGHQSVAPARTSGKGSHVQQASGYVTSAIDALDTVLDIAGDRSAPIVDDVTEMLTKARAHLGNSLFLKTEELAERWRCSEGLLHNWRVSGYGPVFVRPGGKKRGRVLYSISAIESWERENAFSSTT